MKNQSKSLFKYVAIATAIGAFAAPQAQAQSFWDLIFGRGSTSPPPKPAVSKFDLKKDVTALDIMSGELLNSFRNEAARTPGHGGARPDAYGHGGKGQGKARINPKRQLMLKTISDYTVKVDKLAIAARQPHGPNIPVLKKSMGEICGSLETIQKLNAEIKTSPTIDALVKKNTVFATRVNKDIALMKVKVRPVIKQDALALDRLSGELLTSFQNDTNTFRRAGKGGGYGKGGKTYGQSGNAYGKGGHSKGINPRRQTFQKQITDYCAQVDKLIVATNYPHATKHPALKKALPEICASLAAIEKYQHEVKISETTAGIIKRNTALANKINKVTTLY